MSEHRLQDCMYGSLCEKCDPYHLLDAALDISQPYLGQGASLCVCGRKWSEHLSEERDPVIPFTQYLRPDGRARAMWFPTTTDLAVKAKALIDRGYVFEAETLLTGTVSLTVADKEAEEDVAIELCDNGPEVVNAIEKLVESATQAVRR